MSQLLEQFTQTIDPFLLGHSRAEMLGLGLPAVDGLCFPYIAGGVILRRRRLYPTVGEWSFCGFARPNEITITSMLGYGHEANMAYEYAAAQVLGNGYAGEFSEPVRLEFDSSGNIVTSLRPNAPLHVVAEPIAGGQFLVSWEYDAYGQGAGPYQFFVYAGADSASVNYAVPLTDATTGEQTVPVVGNKRRYQLTTEAFANGTTRVFAVRSRNADGFTEKNTFTSSPKTARATAEAGLGSLVSGVMRKA